MAYVKISDPKIIDLSTVHQIINVVNQHSDNLTALTNNFGANYAGSQGTTNAETTSYQFDISSQQIFYGETEFKFDNNNLNSKWISSPTGGQHFQISVTFPGQFTVAPSVTATMQTSGDTGSSLFANMNVWVSHISTSGFRLNVRSLNQNTQWGSSGSIWADWIAIGPKG